MDDLSTRLAALQTAHPWMDAFTSTTVAQQPISTQQMMQVAESLRTQTASTFSGYTPYSYDPALHQPSSTKAFAQQYVNTVTAGNPFDTSSLTTMQRNLQAQGFGTGLTITGAWNADWQQALQQHASQHFADQMSGDRPGATTSHGLLHSMLHALSPTGIASAVVGTIKSLPSDFRDLGSDLAGGVTEIGGIATYGLEQAVTGHGLEGVRASQRAGARVGAGIESALGNKMTAEEYYAKVQDWGRAVNDLGTLLMIVPGVGEAVGAGAKGLTTLMRGADIAEAQAGQGLIRSSLGRTVGHEAAQRTPGLTAAAVGSRAGKRILTGAGIGGTAGGVNAEINGGDLTTGIVSGALLGGAAGGLTRFAERAGSATTRLPENALDNIPVLKQTGAVIDRLASEDGLYYRMRSTLAKPYEYGAVRLAGQGLTKSQAVSLKINGLSWLENTVGDDPNSQPLARYVAGSHPLDPLDHALATAAQKLHLPFTPKVDWLMYALHGDLNGVGKEGVESEGLTGNTSRKAQAIHDAIDNALGQTGYAERVVRGTGRSYEQLLADANGNEEHLQDWMWDKVHHAAATLYAQKVLRDLPDPEKMRISSDRDLLVPFLQTAKDEALANPATMEEAHSILSQAKNANYLETYIHNELIASKTQPGESLRHEIGTYIPVANRLRDDILPRIETDFLTPQEAEFAPKGSDPQYKKLLSKAGLTWQGMKEAKGSVAAGSIGLMRKGKLTSQQALEDLKGYDAKYQALLAERETLVGSGSLTMAQAAARGARTEAERHAALIENNERLADLHADLMDYAYNQHGLTRRPLAVYKGLDPEQGVKQMLDLLADARKNLASEVFLAPDASAEATAAYNFIKDNGYIPVHGKDIGHLYLNLIKRPGSLGNLATRRRQIAQTLGLGTERYSQMNVASQQRLAIVSRLEQAQARGSVSFGQHGTARDVLNDLTDKNLLADKDNTWAEKIAFGASSPLHSRDIKGLMEHYDETPQQAEARLRQDIALAGGLRGLSTKEVVRILTRKDADGVPIMDEASALRVHDAIRAGMADTNIRMVGLTHLEDLMRFGAFRFAAEHNWDLDKWRYLMALPDKLIRARDNWRFAMNPMFSVRRVVKTNVKMVADGVQASHNPVRWMAERGAYDEAHTLLDSISGIQKGHYEYLDEAQRYIDQHDMWGIYNPRSYKAMYAWQKKQQGFSDEEIRQGLNRVFDYGGRGEQGRTAAERTANVFFFPFSFEKTLLRSVGGYLLDHQAQALVLDQALDSYRQFSAAHPNSPLTSKWIDKHAPVLNEALRLNAFAHGISPGEFGGINRPILNAFMPQHWATSKDSMKTLERFVPAISDLHRIMGEINAQQSVIRTSVANGIARFDGHGGNALFRLPSNEVKTAQIGDALVFKLQLNDAFQNVIDYNDSQGSDEAKYHFGYGDNIPPVVRGEVINKSTLAILVHQAYPAFDPNKAGEIAKQHAQDARVWVNSRTHDPKFAQYSEYLDAATTASEHMTKDDYPLDQLTAVQALFRSQAADLSRNNPSFRRLYDRTWARYFGPLG